MPCHNRAPVITLTTDFGLRDSFVGTMKGVILSRCRNARIVDITHMVPQGDVRAGAFALLTACRFFPKGTVHVAVVDPGVGSGRPAIVGRTAEGTFIGPDNGLLSWAMSNAKNFVVRRIANRRLFLLPVSATFHGRDIFAPVAAHLACGGRFDAIGPETDEWIRLPWPAPTRTKKGWLGEIVYVDHFGNAFTTLPNEVLDLGEEDGGVVVFGRHRIPVRACYSAVPVGKAVAVPGSSGYIEVAVNGGNAARTLGLRCGLKARLVVLGPRSRRNA